MQTQKMAFLDFLGQPQTQFAIPLFQRVYSWEPKECGDFWDDIIKAGQADRTHFMGVVLYVLDAECWKGTDQLNIVDGQQRLTTFTILLTAVQRYMREHGIEAGGMNANDISARYLLTAADGELQPKLILTHLDRFTLYELILGVDPSEEHAQRILDNFNYFYDRMNEEGFDFDVLWRGITGLFILNVMLTGEDSPQFVFESLNSKGLSLTTGDLLRSRVLLWDEENPDANLYEEYWLPLQTIGESVIDPIEGTSMLVEAWVAYKCRRRSLIHDETEIYPFLKDLLRENYRNNLQSLLKNMLRYAKKLEEREDFREDQLLNRSEWIKGRLAGNLGELKLFGD